jgi:hypothetical protein
MSGDLERPVEEQIDSVTVEHERVEGIGNLHARRA